MFEKLGAVLIFFGLVFVGAMTLSQYTQYLTGRANDAGALSGFGWMIVGLGALLRFYPTKADLEVPSLSER